MQAQDREPRLSTTRVINRVARSAARHGRSRAYVFLFLALVIGGCRSDGAPDPEPIQLFPEKNLVVAPVGERPQLARFVIGAIGNPLLDYAGVNGYALAADSDMLFYDAMAQLHDLPKVDVIVIGGNCIHNTDNGGADLDLFTLRVRAALIPCRVVLGPRDSGGATGKQAQRGQVIAELRGKELPADGRAYRIESPAAGLHLIYLDSTEAALGRGGFVGADQLQWLERTVANLAPTDVAIVFLHHLLLDLWDASLAPVAPRLQESTREHLVENRAQVRQILESAMPVKAVISSSFGLPTIRNVGGLHYLSTPALAHYPCAFRVLTLEGDSIRVETRSISEPKVETLAILALREDRKRTWEYYGFGTPDQFASFLRGGNEDWHATLTMR